MRAASGIPRFRAGLCRWESNWISINLFHDLGWRDKERGQAHLPDHEMTKGFSYDLPASF
jgi:hypothetical protein